MDTNEAVKIINSDLKTGNDNSNGGIDIGGSSSSSDNTK